jgi:hypothetical protein
MSATRPTLCVSRASSRTPTRWRTSS